MNLSFVTTLGIGRMPFLNERASFATPGLFKRGLPTDGTVQV